MQQSKIGNFDIKLPAFRPSAPELEYTRDWHTAQKYTVVSYAVVSAGCIPRQVLFPANGLTHAKKTILEIS